MSKGYFLIGSFNPNEDVGIDRIKALASELIDEIEASSNEYVCDEAKQLCYQANLLVLQAQMLAVKAIYLGQQS